jgi:ABC-type branched-subunit amino acid transport system substrate-binding protein
MIMTNQITRTKALAFAALATGALGCTTTEEDAAIPPDAIRIAALIDQTGTSATLAYSAAIKLAFNQMNQGLQASSQRRIEFGLLLRDTASRSAQAVMQAEEVVISAGARALVTEISADTIAVNALNYREQSPLRVPINCFACSSSFINDPAAVDAMPLTQAAERDEQNYLRRIFMNSKYEAAVQMRVAMSRGDNGDVNGDGHFKVALIATDDVYGKGWESALRAKMMQMHAAASSIEVMYVDPRVNDTSYNWTTDLTRLVDRHNETTGADDGIPDTVFLALLPVGSAAATKAYREAGYDIPLQATTAFRRLHILRSLGPVAEGVEGGSPRAAAGQSGADFENAFKAEYGEDPEMLTSGAYDCAVTHMLAALMAVGTHGDPALATAGAIRENLDRINDPQAPIVGVGPAEFARAADLLHAGRTINYLGATGSTAFDRYGNNTPEMVHYRVEGRQFRELEAYSCADANPLCVAADH